MDIKREILPNLIAHLDKPEITVIIGPRQAGKTYLMRRLQKHVESQNQRTVFLNLDVEDHRQLLRSQSDFIAYLDLQLGKQKGTVFLDEIQRKENAGLFLKGLFDLELPYKLVVSGSGSLDIKAHIKESLAGRKRVFEIFPLSFSEFINFKTSYQFENKLEEYLKIEKSQSIRYLEEYMKFGGYPKVVLAQTSDEKKIEISEIYSSYIEKDISGLLRVDKSDKFSSLLKVLASQIGQLINISELSSTLGLSQQTVQKYLWYLEETYILAKSTPFHTNLRSEISKSPMYYFIDLGLRNYLLGLFNSSPIPTILAGHLFENAIYNHLQKPVNFWRTTDNAEVDFVINTPLSPTPIEAKYQNLSKPTITRSYQNFLLKYKPTTGYVVHLGENMRLQQNQTEITFIPFWKTLVANFGLPAQTRKNL